MRLTSHHRPRAGRSLKAGPRHRGGSHALPRQRRINVTPNRFFLPFGRRRVIDPVLKRTEHELEELGQMDEGVDRLHAAMVSYIDRLSTENLTKDQSALAARYLGTANSLETISNMIETNLVDLGKSRLESGVEISSSTREIVGRSVRASLAPLARPYG